MAANKTQCQRILGDLQRKSNKGISALDYPTGLRLGARIYDLRQAGNNIVTRIDKVSGLARYWLINDAKLRKVA